MDITKFNKEPISQYDFYMNDVFLLNELIELKNEVINIKELLGE